VSKAGECPGGADVPGGGFKLGGGGLRQGGARSADLDVGKESRQRVLFLTWKSITSSELVIFQTISCSCVSC
jgi:hypothetical protein